eukprot:1187108-Prorocentrum_minimum.AAC.5
MPGAGVAGAPRQTEALTERRAERGGGTGGRESPARPPAGAKGGGPRVGLYEYPEWEQVILATNKGLRGAERTLAVIGTGGPVKRRNVVSNNKRVLQERIGRLYPPIE